MSIDPKTLRLEIAYWKGLYQGAKKTVRGLRYDLTKLRNRIKRRSKL